MSFLLYRLSRFSARHHWAVIITWLLILMLTIGAVAVFGGKLSNEFKIPGSETQVMLDKLKQDLPEAAGGSAGIVLKSTQDAGFSAEDREATARALQRLNEDSAVESTLNPFLQEEQLATAHKSLEEGKAQLAAAAPQFAQLKETYEQASAQREAAGGQLPPEAEAQYQQLQSQYTAAATQKETAEKQLSEGERRLQATEGLKFVSENNKVALAQVQFTKPVNSLELETREQIQDEVTKELPSGVEALFSKEITEDPSDIFGPSEIIGVGVAGLVLLLMLGTLIAAGLPILMALIGVGIGVGGTFALSGVVEMSSVTPMLAMMLGLAVGIDYSLFIVNRHRQQLLAGMDMEESIGRATGTSGNAVVFAGLTVVIALTALVIPGLPFLGVMGLAAAATVAIAVLIAITLTPAVLSLVGKRLISKRAWQKAEAQKDQAKPATRHGNQASQGKGWGALIARYPLVMLLLTILALGTLALPAKDLQLALPDGGAEPKKSQAYQAYRLTEENFGEGANGPIVVVGEFPAGWSEEQAQEKQYQVADRLREVDGVKVSMPMALSEDRQTAVFQVIPEQGPASEATVKVVQDLRAIRGSLEQDLQVKTGLTGQTAANVDVSAQLAAALPPYLVVVVGLSLLLLLLAFRSVVVPLLATGGFLLSLAASFGAVVAIYQWGWLGDVFQVTTPGPIFPMLPIILTGVLFGLAMDYQVFITSGMREAYTHGEPARQAVRTGFSLASRVVVAAAIIMVAVFAGFIYSNLTMIRPLGFALAFGVLIDAFVVRMTLIPAAMTLLGKTAWWMPKWVDRILPDVDVEGAKLAEKTMSTAEEKTAKPEEKPAP